MSASFALLIPSLVTNALEAPPSATSPRLEKGVKRKVEGTQYIKSENAMSAADNPMAGPLRAVMRIFGCV